MFWKKRPPPGGAGPDRDPQSAAIVELAKRLIELMREIAPDWQAAYYRYQQSPGQTAANGSYVQGADVTLIGAMRHGAFYEAMGALSAGLLAEIGKPRAVLLLRAGSDFSYDVKFEYDDLDRWKITKLDGRTGIPEGEPGS
jgi:hypothetical protein